jgi:cholesterol transport system auxiliary component
MINFASVSTKAVYCIMMLIMAMVLASCSLLSPVSVVAPNKYVINVVPQAVSGLSHHKRAGVLLVAVPDIRPIYNTTRIAYTRTPFQVEYFAQSEWAETPSQMLQSLIVKTLEKTGRYQAVVTPPFAAHYDYVLMTQIERFHQRLSPGTPTFEVVVSAQLIHASTNQVVASKVLSASVTHTYSTPYSTVLAANQATADILKQVVNLCFYDKKRRSSQ